MPRRFATRTAETAVDPLLLERWSPRAFSPEPVAEEMLSALFEAARFAPSAANEQPWLFLYAATAEELARFRPLLVDGNRRWADRAPVLAFVLARRRFARKDEVNDWAAFDAGAAWMALAVQARLLGLYTHAMAGFHQDKVYEVLGVPRGDYAVLAAIAIGKLGDRAQLPPDLAEREQPTPRKPLAEVAIAGRFPGGLGGKP
jgi:nitroreductase